jgi:hypothetical protein
MVSPYVWWGRVWEMGSGNGEVKLWVGSYVMWSQWMVRSCVGWGRVWEMGSANGEVKLWVGLSVEWGRV